MDQRRQTQSRAGQPLLGRESRAWSLAALLLGLTLSFAVVAVGDEYVYGYRLALGELGLPAAPLVAFAAVYGVLGGLGVLASSLGAAQLLGSSRLRLAARRPLTPGRSAQLLAALVALFVPLVLRLLVFEEAPFTDDEGSYLFSARLLADARLYAESHPDKLFFDRQFMFNEGRWFSQYFLGWPLLLAPFAAFGLESLANPVYAALAVPAVYRVGNRLAGPAGARTSLLLYVAAPMLFVAAATLLSHTVGVAILAWASWLALRSRDADARPVHHAALGALLALGFCVRPLTALGYGLPVALYWLAGLRGRRDRLTAVSAFLAPALALGGIFLYVNAAQTGSPWSTAYMAVLDYKARSGYRFASYVQHVKESGSLFHAGSPARALAVAGAALFRLDLSTFGWPSSLLLVLPAWGDSRALLPFGTVLGFFSSHWFARSVGIDAFGPVHYLELGLPLVWLSAIGLRRLSLLVRRRLGRARASRPAARLFARCLLVALLASAGLVYLPVRLGALTTATGRVAAVLRLPHETGAAKVIVFAPERWLGSCNVQPISHMLFRPENPPALDSDVLWVNHLGAARDLAFQQQHFPEHEPFVLAWSPQCAPTLLSLRARSP